MSFDEPDGLPAATDDDLALSAYADGLASPAERARVDADPVLAARLARYRAVADLLAEERAAALAGGDGARAATEPELEAALDQARAAALAAVDPPPTAVNPADRFAAPSRARHPRRQTGRWVVQVVGLAAALLVAVGAVALIGGRDDDGSVGLETAEAPTTAPPGAAFEAGKEADDRDTSGSAAEDGGGESAERAVTAQAADAAPSAAGAPLLAAPPPVLGDYASVDELVAQLSPASVAPTTTRPGPTGSSAGPGSAGVACAPPGATVLGTATVAGRAVLVTELTDGSGRRLVGLDPADCAPVFDRLR